MHIHITGRNVQSFIKPQRIQCNQVRTGGKASEKKKNTHKSPAHLDGVHLY